MPVSNRLKKMKSVYWSWLRSSNLLKIKSEITLCWECLTKYANNNNNSNSNGNNNNNVAEVSSENSFKKFLFQRIGERGII